MRNAAKNRQKIGKNPDVDNIRGRELHHHLIAQMKELPAWQLHLQKLKEELVVQEDKWDHREEERLEIERKKEEIRKLEEEMEKIKDQKRREKTEIVREDLMIAAQEEELRN